MEKMLIAVLAVMCLPAYVLAQTPPRITGSPCYWLYSIPSVAQDDGTGDLTYGSATNPILGELRELGFVNASRASVGGARDLLCWIAVGGRPKQPKLGQARDLLHSVGQGSKISESEARDIFNAPWYQAYADPETGLRMFFDGRDGRELLTHPSDSRRLYQLYDTARRWLNRCGTALPLPAGC